MKGVIVSGKLMGWEEELLGLSSRLEFSFVNKKLFEYYLDLFHLVGITEVLILQDSYSPKLNGIIESYKSWFEKIEISSYDADKPIEWEVSRFQKFLSRDEIFLIEANSFVFYDKENENLFSLDKNKNYWITSDINNSNFVTREVKGIQDYYSLNLDLIQEYKTNYNFQGYLSEGCYFGRSNKIESNTSNSQTHFGNNVTVDNSVVIGGTNLIGNGVFLGQNCRLSGTIVLDNVLVNNELDLKNKIVTKDKIVCPETGIFFEADDEVTLSSEIDYSFENLFIQYLVGLLVLPLSFCMTLYLSFFKKGEIFFFYDLRGKNREILLFKNQKKLNTILRLASFCKGHVKLLGSLDEKGSQYSLGVFSLKSVFGEDDFLSGHASFLTLKNSTFYEISLLLRSLK